MSDELTLLRQENERLKLLVQLLSDKLTTLARMTTELYEFANSHETAREMALQQDALGKTGDFFPNTETRQGQPTSLYPTTEDDIGKDDTPLSYINNLHKDKRDTSFPMRIVEQGQTTSLYPTTESDTRKDDSPLSNTANAANGSELTAVEKPINAGLLKTALRSHGIYNKGALAASVKTIMRLHANNHTTYQNLQSLTGLSASGMAKHIMSLKKRGLIVRTAYQQYDLTLAAKRILERSRG